MKKRVIPYPRKLTSKSQLTPDQHKDNKCLSVNTYNFPAMFLLAISMISLNFTSEISGRYLWGYTYYSNMFRQHMPI